MHGQVYFYGLGKVRNKFSSFVFIWNIFHQINCIDSNKTEIKDAERIAYDYLRTDPSHRDPDTPIMKTKQSHEPIHFTGFFGPWDRNYWTVNYIFIIR
jgi:hypothetical protein